MTVRLRAIISGLVGVLVVAAAGAWVERAPLLVGAGTRLIDRAGWGPARFNVDHVGISSATLTDVRLCGGALSARRVELDYRAPDLLARRLARVEIVGLDAKALDAGGRITLGVCRPLGQGGGSARVTIGTVVLSDAHLSLAGADGPIDLALSATMSISGDAIEGHGLMARLTTTHTGTTDLKVSHFSFGAAKDGASLSFDGANLADPKLALAVRSAAGFAAWRMGGASVTLTTGRIIDLASSPRFSPTTFSGTAMLKESRLDFSVAGRIGGALPVGAKGFYDTVRRRGEAAVTAGPVVFRRKGLQPATLFPAAPRVLGQVEGSLSLKGTVRLANGALTPDLAVRIDGAGFEAKGVRVSGLSGALRFIRLSPLATAAHQRLQAMVEAPGLAPTAIKIKGSLKPYGRLEVEDASFSLAGGTISTGRFAIDPANPRLDAKIRVKALQLGNLAQMLHIPGLSGDGRLDGVVPLAIEHGEISIPGAKLAAEGPGKIRYAPENPPAALAAGGAAVDLTLKVLRDFHYDSLSIELDKPASGVGTVVLHALGRNPAVMKGQSFRFNIRVESDFDRLMRYATLELNILEDALRESTPRSQK